MLEKRSGSSLAALRDVGNKVREVRREVRSGVAGVLPVQRSHISPCVLIQGGVRWGPREVK